MKANSRSSVLGNFSFDGDSLPDFSEFDSDSVIEEYHRESSCRPSDDKMAPTQTIETVTITRPLKLSSTAHQTEPDLQYHQRPQPATSATEEQQEAEEEMAEIRNPIAQVIAFICGLMVIGLLIMALVSTDWLMAAGWRQGLFAHCVGENSPTPLPFNVPNQGPDCYKARDAVYMKVAAALCIVGLITDIIATLLTGLGLRSKDHRTKYKYYRIAVYVMILSLVSVLLALVVYPVFFATELNEGNRTVWEFGWAYGVGWGAAIFLFGAVVLLLCDKESEEIYYKERKVAA